MGGHRPSARVVMIGAGQLARMTQQAAVDLDVELTVVATAADDPAVLAGAPHRIGHHRNADELVAAVAGADVVTFDHELVPPEALAALADAGARLRPGPGALRFAQDKLFARRELSAAGLPVPAFAPVVGPADLDDFAAAHGGWPVVLKARSGGYDGRGVLVVERADDLPDLRPGPDGEPAWLVEEHLALEAEVAVVVARRPGGTSVTYPPVRTTQVDGICTHLVAPTGLGGLDAEATALAADAAERIGAVGLCAVELFVAGGHLLVNEVALRPHNSGHATIEANTTSQFEQHLRAVLDWPLGDTAAVTPAAAMVNLLGVEGADPVDRLPAALAIQGAHVHLYGKATRPGRKIGHVTALAATTDQALAVATAAASILGGDKS